MVQLQHVHVAHRDRTRKGFAAATVVERGLSTLRQIGQREHVLDLGFGRAVEHRRRGGYAGAQVVRKRQYLIVVERLEILLFAAGVVHLVEELAHVLGLVLRIQHASDL